MNSMSFDFSHSPFDDLNTNERELVTQAIDIEYFPSGTPIITVDAPVDAFYVLIKGAVAEQRDNEIVSAYGVNDSFDTRSLISGRANAQITALEDTLAFRIPRAVILTLTERNPLFGAYFFQDVAKRLSALAHRSHQQAVQSMMLARVEQAFIREPFWLDENATVLDAAQLMRNSRTTSILVRTCDGRTGIFTQSDLRNFVIDGRSAKTVKVAELAHYELLTVDASDPIHYAILIMTRHSIQRVVVTRDGAVIGVLEQVELLAFITHNSHLVTAQIERAQSIEDLHQAWCNTDQLIATLHQNGIKVTLIAELMGVLRHKLHERIFSLLAPAEMFAHVCLLALGSEGRGEQILKTDQDNALVIEDGYTHPDLADICRKFSETLIEFGYPRCQGDIMVSNPFWQRSVTSYKKLINDWIDNASGDSIMQLAIWSDARPVCGQHTLFKEVHGYLLRNLSRNDSFLARFAQPIEQFDTPLDFFSRLVTNKGKDRSQLDLKKGGIFPLVHGLRSLALEAGLEVNNSYKRIDALAQKDILTPVMAQDLAESLAFLQGLQLKYGLQKLAVGQPMSNLVDPRQLTTLERDLLKDTFAVVKAFKQKLRTRYRMYAL